MGEILIGYAIGMGIACLVWVVGMVIWCIITARKDDRRFDAMIRGMDAGREQAWREAGVSEETIALFYTKREELMKDLKGEA